MKLFTTHYRGCGPVKLSRGSIYGSQIFAKDRRDAKRIVALRGIGETVGGVALDQKPYILASEILARTEPRMDQTAGDYAALMHACCYEGWLALSSGVATADDLFADHGIIHQVAHYVAFDLTMVKRRDILVAALYGLERRIPGLVDDGEKVLPAPAPADAARDRDLADSQEPATAPVRRRKPARTGAPVRKK